MHRAEGAADLGDLPRQEGQDHAQGKARGGKDGMADEDTVFHGFKVSLSNWSAVLNGSRALGRD